MVCHIIMIVGLNHEAVSNYRSLHRQQELLPDVHAAIHHLMHICLQRVASAIDNLHVALERGGGDPIAKGRHVTGLDYTYSQLIESSLDAWAHIHFHLSRFRADTRFELLSVVFWSCSIRTQFEEALHVVIVLTIWIVKSHPYMLNFPLLREIN